MRIKHFHAVGAAVIACIVFLSPAWQEALASVHGSGDSPAGHRTEAGFHAAVDGQSYRIGIRRKDAAMHTPVDNTGKAGEWTFRTRRGEMVSVIWEALDKQVPGSIGRMPNDLPRLPGEGKRRRILLPDSENGAVCSTMVLPLSLTEAYRSCRICLARAGWKTTPLHSSGGQAEEILRVKRGKEEGWARFSTRDGETRITWLGYRMR